MQIETIDGSGKRFPGCFVRVVSKAAHMKKGSILEARCDCPTFEKDMRTYCQATDKVFLSVESGGGKIKIIRIQI